MTAASLKEVLHLRDHADLAAMFRYERQLDAVGLQLIEPRLEVGDALRPVLQGVVQDVAANAGPARDAVGVSQLLLQDLHRVLGGGRVQGLSVQARYELDGLGGDRRSAVLGDVREEVADHRSISVRAEDGPSRLLRSSHPSCRNGACHPSGRLWKGGTRMEDPEVLQSAWRRGRGRARWAASGNESALLAGPGTARHAAARRAVASRASTAWS